MMEFLSSVIRYISVEANRYFFHTRRFITGMPELSKTAVTPQLYVGGQYRLRGLKTLKKWGITAVVNMRETSFKQASHADWLDYLHLPTRDLNPPSIEMLDAGVAFIQRHVTNGGKVYVHCRWGEGRGPSMAAAYLISTGMTADHALGVIKKVRDFIRLTKAQIKRLEEYERYLKEKTNRG